MDIKNKDINLISNNNKSVSLIHNLPLISNKSLIKNDTCKSKEMIQFNSN